MSEQSADYAVDVTECERRCVEQQRALVACVNSIRDAAAGGANVDYNATVRTDATAAAAAATTTIATRASSCLSGAVLAWTTCCEMANEGRARGREGVQV